MLLLKDNYQTIRKDIEDIKDIESQQKTTSIKRHKSSRGRRRKKPREITKIRKDENSDKVKSCIFWIIHLILLSNHI